MSLIISCLDWCGGDAGGAHWHCCSIFPPVRYFYSYSSYLILITDYAFLAHSIGPSPRYVLSNVGTGWGACCSGGVFFWHCGHLCRDRRCCIWHINHGLGDIMVHSSFNVDRVEHLLHALARSQQNSDSWSLMYSLKVSFFQRPTFWISLTK